MLEKGACSRRNDIIARVFWGRVVSWFAAAIAEFVLVLVARRVTGAHSLLLSFCSVVQQVVVVPYDFRRKPCRLSALW